MWKGWGSAPPKDEGQAKMIMHPDGNHIAFAGAVDKNIAQ